MNIIAVNINLTRNRTEHLQWDDKPRFYRRRNPTVGAAENSDVFALDNSELGHTDVLKPSSSPWSSPVVLVPKKDGTTR